MLSDKSWSLVVAGSGDSQYFKMCLNLAEKCGILNRVLFVGSIPGFLLKYLYSFAYVYTLTSMFKSLPASILKTMACGSSVIATRVGGLPEVIKHSKTGLLIDKSNPVELARTLELILTDENLRERLSVNGLNYVRRYFSWQVNAERYVRLAFGEMP